LKKADVEPIYLVIRFYLGLPNKPISQKAPSLLTTHQLPSFINNTANVSDEELALVEVLWWLNKALAFSDFYKGKCTRWV